MSFGRSHLLIAGLGNLPLPRTRHRYMSLDYNRYHSLPSYSVGHYLIDSLANRFGVVLQSSPEKKIRGSVAHTDIVVDDRKERLTLFKHRARR